MKKSLTPLILLAFIACSANYPTDVVELRDNDLESSFIFSPQSKTVVFTEFKNPIKGYKVYSSEENPDLDPVCWVLSGSYDGKKWVDIDKQSDIEFCSRFQEVYCKIDEPSNYTQYKLSLIFADNQTEVTLGEVCFFEKDIEEGWSNFNYPEVTFTVEHPDREGANIYLQLVQNPEEYVKFHARKVAEILFYTAQDTMYNVRRIDYTLRDYDGISSKGGNPDAITIQYSTRHVENSAAESLYKLDFETRGVLYHELTHAYQFEPKGCGDYGSNKVFWSCIEGVADAVRSEAGYFDMSTRKPGGNWMDGYRTTGFFIQWMTYDDPDAIRKFHETVRDLEAWSWDDAIKSMFGPEASIESKWEEYQKFLKS